MLALMSDPDAAATSVQAGAAFPFGSGDHVALLGRHYAAHASGHPDATTASDVLALTLVRRHGTGAYWTVGPRLHLVSPRGGAPKISASEARSRDKRRSARRSKAGGRSRPKRPGTRPR